MIATSITQDLLETNHQPTSNGSTNQTTSSPLTGLITMDIKDSILLLLLKGTSSSKSTLIPNGSSDLVMEMLPGKSWLELQEKPKKKFMKLKVDNAIVPTLWMVHPLIYSMLEQTVSTSLDTISQLRSSAMQQEISQESKDQEQPTNFSTRLKNSLQTSHHNQTHGVNSKSFLLKTTSTT